MKKLLLALICVGFASSSVFAGSCCGGAKKEGEKGKDATKSSLTVQP